MDDMRQAPQIVLGGGLRRVMPYYFDYKTPFKERWRGKTIADVLTAELGQSASLVERGLEARSIYVTTGNGRRGLPQALYGPEARARLLAPHDIIHNKQHTHEPAIIWREQERDFVGTKGCDDGVLAKLQRVIGVGPGAKIAGPGGARRTEAHLVLHQTPHYIIANKPGGVPTHPGGIYRHNTLTEIIAQDCGPVYPCHRLDKSTLGLVVLARSPQGAGQLAGARKYYLARVHGRFPHEAIRYTCPVFSINTSGGYISGAVPAESTTEIHFLAYSAESDHSLLLCRPVTGRTHQIRIHLRNLGHPIANDDLYGTGGEKNEIELAMLARIPEYGPNFEELEVQENGESTRSQLAEALGPESRAPSVIPHEKLLLDDLKSRIAAISKTRAVVDSAKITGTCHECGGPLYLDNPSPGIWLHALALHISALAQNLGPLTITTPLPAWCALASPETHSVDKPPFPK